MKIPGAQQIFIFSQKLTENIFQILVFQKALQKLLQKVLQLKVLCDFPLDLPRLNFKWEYLVSKLAFFKGYLIQKIPSPTSQIYNFAHKCSGKFRIT